MDKLGLDLLNLDLDERKAAVARPVGAQLWRLLCVYQIFGANTDVGKTVFTTNLINTVTENRPNAKVAYLKPVSTGPKSKADNIHLQTYTLPTVMVETKFQYDLESSPHTAAEKEFLLTGVRIPGDSEITGHIREFSRGFASPSKPGWLFVETAGGVHTPSPTGTSQAELYRELRLPIILVGDSRLGGISSTISAFESLKLRGYDVVMVLVFRRMSDTLVNHKYLADYFEEHGGVPVVTYPAPPEHVGVVAFERYNMREYYETASRSEAMTYAVKVLETYHTNRLAQLQSMSREATEVLWYPFTQHIELTPSNITVIDSAWGSYFQTLVRTGDLVTRYLERLGLLESTFDGTASWWTQGLGHGNSALALSAASAAGRYGHVMFPGMVHEPALRLAQELLDVVKNPRLTRVFFSDNGSTGVEVAIKMAMRATRMRYDIEMTEDTNLGVLGIKGGYHGDTIGAMDCAAPGHFNEDVEWYKGRGYWFPAPTVECSQGIWRVLLPNEIKDISDTPEVARYTFKSLEQVFDLQTRGVLALSETYKRFIVAKLKALAEEGYKGERNFGALILEPVVLGAGGMQLVDPMFQRTLIEVVRESAADIFYKDRMQSGFAELGLRDTAIWKGLPVIFDEVLTGLGRLGRMSAGSFFGSTDTNADIVVHAKLLTGGLVPLAATLASESIFDAFKGDYASSGLLHGHSYTAYPVGCQVALDTLRFFKAAQTKAEEKLAAENKEAENDMTESQKFYQHLADEAEKEPPKRAPSVWSSKLIHFISNQPSVAGVWNLGTILSIRMKTRYEDGKYTSQALMLQQELAEKKIHTRRLENVLYVMASLTAEAPEIQEISNEVERAFNHLQWEGP
ncbi:hypothetical protein B0H63DRAFT_501654 [Podospora didyma]|uniref:Uncharacterized protein n=1 Tax=Podospora didyma TaxID=330526 RepID=A0AAE0U0I4_9PEZI|nr:hypothetical protein B0H63DRAFT_501654 [Podospora didyma]